MSFKSAPVFLFSLLVAILPLCLPASAFDQPTPGIPDHDTSQIIDYSQDEMQLKQQLQMAEVQAPNAISTARTAYQLAEVFRKEQFYAGALDRYKQALKIITQQPGLAGASQMPVNLDFRLSNPFSFVGGVPPSADAARVFGGIGQLFLDQGQYQLSEQYLKKALQIWQESASGTSGSIGSDEGSLNTAQSMTNLADLYRVQGRFYEAEPLYRRALGLKESVYGSDSPSLLPALRKLAGYYRQQSRLDDAAQIENRIKAVCPN